MDENEFSAYMNGIYQKGCVMLAVSVAQDLGVIALLGQATTPLSLQWVAEQLSLKERYTRELLSALVAADILHQDRETRLYTLPASHRPVLARIAAVAPIVVFLSKRSDAIKRCFQKDGPWGVSYAESPEFFDWYQACRAGVSDHVVTTELLPLWHKQPEMIQKLDAGMSVLDDGCGPGTILCILAQTFPNSTFVGVDYSPAAIQMANTLRESKSLTNVTFIEGDAHNLSDHWTSFFDMVFMYDTLHDLPRPHRAISEMYRVLKPGGWLSLMEMGFHSDPVDNAGNQSAAMYYTVSMFVCLSSSLSEEPHVGYGACWGVEEVKKALLEAEFIIISTANLTVVANKILFLCRKLAKA